MTFPDLLSLARGILENLGLLALLVMGYGFLVRATAGLAARGLSLGLLFALGAAIALASPHQVAPGVFVDARGVILGLAGPFAGPLAAAVAAVSASAVRLTVGGDGAWAGVVGILTATAGGVIFHYVFRRNRPGLGLGDLLILGALASTQVFTLLLVPGGLGWRVFLEVGPPLTGITISGIVLLGAFLSLEAERLRDERQLRRQAGTDPLTGLANRRAFEKAAAQILSLARRGGHPVSVLLVDCDHFKAVNDRHGHDVGDSVLMALAHLMAGAVRGGDVVARLGGEEFVLLLPETDTAQARILADRLRQEVETLTVPTSAGPVSITVSVGLAGLSDECPDLERLLKAADRALYRAKQGGRNRVEPAERELGYVI